MQNSFAETQCLTAESQPNFAHAITVQLVCHVKIIVAIALLEFGREQKLNFKEFQLWWKIVSEMGSRIPQTLTAHCEELSLINILLAWQEYPVATHSFFYNNSFPLSTMGNHALWCSQQDINRYHFIVPILNKHEPGIWQFNYIPRYDLIFTQQTCGKQLKTHGCVLRSGGY